MIQGIELLNKLRAVMDEKKATDFTAFDVRRRSSVTDYILIASAGSPPHLKALLHATETAMAQEGVPVYRSSGQPDSGWVIMDYIDVVIHVFIPKTREYYSLEEIWNDCPKVL
jgi:ribosome-associated protein